MLPVFISFLFLFFFSPPLQALPRYAIEEGVSCSSCHTNMTGGGKRNDTGGYDKMREVVLALTQKLAPEKIDGRLNSFLAVGADLRTQNTTTFSQPATNAFSVPQGSLYLEFNGGKHLTGYVDYDFANTFNREAFGMVHDLPLSLYIKAGRIQLPYGLRIADDSSPIRTNFNVTFANPDIGGEIGMAPGPFEFTAALSNGVPGGVADENLAKAVTVSAVWIGEKGRVGASFQWNKRDANRLTSAGMHGGFKLGKLVGLGEIDLQQIHSRTGGGNTLLVAGYGELDYKIIQGFYAKGIYDYLDPDWEAADNLQHRIGLGFDFYPLPFSQLSLLYRVNIGTGAVGDDQLEALFHFFF